MGVNVGNEHKEYHYHYQTEQAASANTTGADAARRGLGALGTAAVVGGSLLGGGGLGALAVNYFSKPATTIVQPAGDPNAYGFDGESVPKQPAGT